MSKIFPGAPWHQNLKRQRDMYFLFSKSEHIVPRCLFVMYLFPKGTCICRTHRIRIYWYSYPFCQFILVASSNMPSPRVRNGLLKIEKLSNGKHSFNFYSVLGQGYFQILPFQHPHKSALFQNNSKAEEYSIKSLM